MPKVKKKENKEDKEQISFWERIQVFFSLLGSSYIMGTLLLVFFFSSLYFIHLTVMNDRLFKFDKYSLEMKSELPRWVEENGLTPKIRLNTKEVSTTFSGKSFFDEDTLGSLHTALMGTHWIKEVSLEKSFPSKIHMTIDFRKPIVAFLYKDYWYSLDSDCFIIPVVEHKGRETLDLIRLVDVPELNQSFKPGELIGAESVKKAVSLSILISNRVTAPGKLLRVVFIKDIEETGCRYKLIFQNGLEVLWGNFLLADEVERFPGKYLTSEEKLGVLFTILNKNPAQLHINVEYSK